MSKSTDGSDEKDVEFKIVRSLYIGLTKPPDFLVEGLIELGDQVLLYGQPKVGKTFLAIQLACALATGRPFLKWEVKQRRKVLYINFEMGERVFARRISKFLIQPKEGLSEPDLVSHFDEQIKDHLLFSVSPRSANISSQKKALAKLIAEHSPDFIVFDTLAKLHGVDEKENNAIQHVLTEVRNVCQKEGDPIAHMIVHHARKTAMNITDSAQNLTAAEIRGGSAIRGEADVILGLASSAGGAGGGAKMKLIMEARNVSLEDLDLEVGDERIFRPAEEQSRQAIKNDFYENLRAAAGEIRKSDVIRILAKNHGIETDTVAKDIGKWMKEDKQIKQKKCPKDKRARMIWLDK